MCGITGIYSFNPVGRLHLIHLEEATMKLSKRGPDAHQTWFDETAGLGHRRLSIIDTSEAANQPMKDPSGRFVIVFNGEIYNYREIRKELSEKGITFQTASDTEVLLQSYIVWGSDCLDKLNGFFAFAIYDQETQSLFVARDRFGIKPLYYYQDENKVLFASEMKALLALVLPKEVDKEALHLYFQLTYIPAPDTIFRGVKKLQPGHFIEIKNRQINLQRYYEIPFSNKPQITNIDEAKTKLVDALRASVQRRLVSDVPLGAFLSGGIDSSIIVALASERVTDLRTFSIGFKDNDYFDETNYAQLVAERYKTNHEVFRVGNDDLLNCVDQVLEYIDEPFADSSALPVYILSELTRRHVTVALSGDGADELFSGYNKHSAWLMSHEDNLSNKFISGLAPIWKLLPKSRYTNLTDTIRKLHKYAEVLKLKEGEKYWFLASFVSDAKIKNLLRSEWQADETYLSDLRNQKTSFINSGSINEVLYSDTQMVLEGDMLTKVDRMSMANSLEVRVPFLDPEVVRLAFQMSEELKITGQRKKIVLKEAFREYLPEELYTRPKHGFEVPLLGWFKKELKSRLDTEVFNRELIESQGIFHWSEISSIKRKLYSIDPGDVHVQVWSLLVFQNWYRRYF